MFPRLTLFGLKGLSFFLEADLMVPWGEIGETKGSLKAGGWWLGWWAGLSSSSLEENGFPGEVGLVGVVGDGGTSWFRGAKFGLHGVGRGWSGADSALECGRSSASGCGC